jgi:drug/metabolite transporter (DMT)-like permease
VSAVTLAVLSALLFGAMTVVLRLGLTRRPDVPLATLVTIGTALVIVLVAAAAEVPGGGVHADVAWPFVLAGVLSPGFGQLFVTLGIHEAGAARVSVVLGIAPLVSVTIAVAVLGEPLQAALALGAVLIVAGGLELARERDRPQHLRLIGLVYAFVAVVLFATRDNLVRWLSTGGSAPPPSVAAAAALIGGAVVLAAILGPRLGARPPVRDVAPFLGVGLLFGLGYICLFEAYFRGNVTVVAPLVATESLWAVAFSALVLRHTEVVGRRLVTGALLVVAGGILIGATTH